MGIARRLALIFRVKANTAPDPAEDPREAGQYDVTDEGLLPG
ncbi:MAG TPA: hypothetical protein VFQ77_21420 [Pseudonocardiaceae bacterium]|nr:hypothetical protein [Pseudonocardiaceae bacterium]